MTEASKPHSEPDEPVLSDYIDLEVYDVVPGPQYRRLVEQLEAAREAALELREHMAYEEYGLVQAAVELILGNDELWENYEHANPASEPSA